MTTLTKNKRLLEKFQSRASVFTNRAGSTTLSHFRIEVHGLEVYKGITATANVRSIAHKLALEWRRFIGD